MRVIVCLCSTITSTINLLSTTISEVSQVAITVYVCVLVAALLIVASISITRSQGNTVFSTEE